MTGFEMTVLLAAVGLGAAAWPLVEYGIHGILSHRFKTPVSPLHWGHHQDPSAVFTSPVAWVPVAAVIWGALALVLGGGLASAFVLGLLGGFARYEYFHWRLHFRRPRTERERRLRGHHLAHHYRRPKLYHGVTTRFWDRVFGTLSDNCEADYERFADRAPIEGPSNLARVYGFSRSR